MLTLRSFLRAVPGVILVVAYSNHRWTLAAERLGDRCGSSPLPLALLAAGPGVKIVSQGVERVGPHRLVFRDPFVEVSEALGIEFVDALLGADRDLDELRLSQDLQVPRDTGLREAREPRGDFTRVSAPAREEVEDRPARRVRD